MMKGTMSLSRWGNSLSIRMPKKILKDFALSEKDSFTYRVEHGEIILKPEKKEKLIDKLFENYDMSQEYPNEIVDKGGAVGEELY